MIHISSSEFRGEIDRFLDAAQREPVFVDADGRQQVVVISAEEFRRLENSDWRHLFAGKSRDEIMEAIKTAAMDPKHSDLYGLSDSAPS